MSEHTADISEQMEKGVGDWITEYFRGSADCSQGVPHRADQGEAYDRGYAAQYELEQLMTERSIGLERDKSRA